MFGDVPANAASEQDRHPAPDRAEAERAVALMEEMSADLRGCAVLGPDGKALAASGAPEPWAEAGRGLLAAADAAREGSRAEHVHVATEDGEAFAFRHGDLAMLAVTERFTLASLVLFDMRTTLRDLADGEVRDRRAPGRGAPATPAEAPLEEAVADPTATEQGAGDAEAES